jgi:hypothetical protein
MEVRRGGVPVRRADGPHLDGVSPMVRMTVVRIRNEKSAQASSPKSGQLAHRPAHIRGLGGMRPSETAIGYSWS